MAARKKSRGSAMANLSVSDLKKVTKRAKEITKKKGSKMSDGSPAAVTGSALNQALREIAGAPGAYTTTPRGNIKNSRKKKARKKK